MISVETAEAYRDEMKKHGVRSELFLYEGEKHGFFNKSKYGETVKEMDRFLTSLGYLESDAAQKVKKFAKKTTGLAWNWSRRHPVPASWKITWSSLAASIC